MSKKDYMGMFSFKFCLLRKVSFFSFFVSVFLSESSGSDRHPFSKFSPLTKSARKCSLLSVAVSGKIEASVIRDRRAPSLLKSLENGH